MISKQWSWGHSNAYLFFYLLIIHLFLVSMENLSEEQRNLFDSSSFFFEYKVQGMQEKDDSGLFHMKIEDTEYLKTVQVQLEKQEEIPEDKLPAWLVESCLKNMPPLLKGIYTYLKSSNSSNLATRVPSFHRFLLLGKPGTSKTTTAEAIAQSLNYQKKIIKGSSLLGAYRGHTAINIRMLFEELKKDSLNKMLIINEVHKLFENPGEHSDHSENATAFWEYIDDIERYNPNIIVVGTANRANKLPPEIKSRFRGQYIYFPLLSEAHLAEVFQTIVKYDESVELAKSIDKNVIEKFSSEHLKKYAVRDVKLFIDTAKMFAYADKEGSDVNGKVLIEEKHFKLALDHFGDPEKVMIFNKEEETSEQRQERLHKETLVLQDQHFVQQKLFEMEREIHQKVTEDAHYYFESNVFDTKFDYKRDENTRRENLLTKLSAYFSDDQKVIFNRHIEEKIKRKVEEIAEEKRQNKEKEEKVKVEAQQNSSNCNVM